MNTMVIYEDSEILVIHKPAGIATETARFGQADVVSELKNYLHRTGQGTYLGMVHRLDQPVEGLLVFGKTQAATRFLTNSLQKGSLKKSYQALVACENEISSEGMLLTDYLCKDAKTNLSKVVDQGTQGAKKAQLVWKPVNCKEIDGCRYALLEIELYTGRHHQIRVQMAHAGMPLLGDHKYGNVYSKELSVKLGIRQTALLAGQLQLIHPKTKEQLSFSLPYPEIWHM